MKNEKKHPNPYIYLFAIVIAFGLLAVGIIIGSKNISNVDIKMDNNTRIAVENLANMTERINAYEQKLKDNVTQWQRRYYNLKDSCEEPIINEVDCWDIDNEILFDCEVKESVWHTPNGLPDHTMTYQIKGIGVKQ